MRLPWVQTFPDRPHDGCVRSANLFASIDVLRVYRITGGPLDGQWSWTSSRLRDLNDGTQRPDVRSGYADTKEEAQAEAEAAYFDDP